jgi:hypothetical protein
MLSLKNRVGVNERDGGALFFARQGLDLELRGSRGGPAPGEQLYTDAPRPTDLA